MNATATVTAPKAIPRGIVKRALAATPWWNAATISRNIVTKLLDDALTLDGTENPGTALRILWVACGNLEQFGLNADADESLFKEALVETAALIEGALALPMNSLSPEARACVHNAADTLAVLNGTPIQKHKSESQAFMEGKAICAQMLRAGLTTTSDDRFVISNYRDKSDEAYVPQQNVSMEFLERLVREPALLDGFSGALTHFLAETIDEQHYECIATASYEACRTFNPYDETKGSRGSNYTAPSLDDQLAAIGIKEDGNV